MSTKSTGNKASYTRHSAEYKQESLKLASQIGVAKAAKQLSIHGIRNVFNCDSGFHRINNFVVGDRRDVDRHVGFW